MKILLLGDASNYHRALSAGLAALGHDVTLASDGGAWMRTGRDIDISRTRAGKLSGAIYWLKLRSMLARDLRGYDVVQLVSPSFVELRPSRLRPLFDRLVAANGSVFLTALGTDSTYVRVLTGPNPPLRYSEWHAGPEMSAWSRTPEARFDAWTSRELASYTDYVYDRVDGVVSALYEYHEVVRAARPDLPLAYGGLPIDLSAIPAAPGRSAADTFKIYLAAHRGREQEKGADILFPLVRAFAADHSREVSLLTPPNMPYADFLRFLGRTDLIVDQLYSYTPATSALLAMASGALAVTGCEPEYMRFIGESAPLPIINPSPQAPEAFLSELERLLREPERTADMRVAARAFVEKHHAAPTVAARFIDFWNKVKS